MRCCTLLVAFALLTAGCDRARDHDTDRDNDRGVPLQDRDTPGAEPSDADGGSLTMQQHCDVAPPPADAHTVQVVFSCDEVAVSTWRIVPEGTVATLRFALESLLEGPTQAERDAGLFSFFSAETAGMLNSVRIEDGVAFVDFRDFSRVIPNASTSAGSAQLLDQLAGTIFQFDALHEAALTFDGDCDAFWNWLQTGCQRLTWSGA